MKKCVFTIVAKNYIGVAQILEESVNLHDPDVDFFIFVADEFSNDFAGTLPENVIIAGKHLDISASSWQDMSFKYNLTEFCTAIKSKCFQHLFYIKGYEKVVFLDPDIYIFNSFDPIFSMLDQYAIVLTPHIAIIKDKYNGELSENGLMGQGLFNLGFCALRSGKQTTKLLSWWNEKLINQCYIDAYSNYFTDQKWMDFLPCFFDNTELLITKHLGMNLAPWNFFERKISINQDIITVSPRETEENDYNQSFPLLFVHYSGYNYKELKKGNIVQNNITSLDTYPDIGFLIKTYGQAIERKADAFDKFIEENYSYSKYENGDDIKSFHRRLYRSLTNKGKIIDKPFQVKMGSFHAKLEKMEMTKPAINVNTEKVTKASLQNVDSKLILFNKITRFFYKLLGFERYVLLLRLLRPFSRYESQIHLLDKQYDKDNITF